MNKLVGKGLWLVACVIGVQVVQSDTASAAACGPNQVYSSSMGQCIPKNAGNGTKVFIPHGCPSNLDKACIKTQGGLLVKCRCVS
jgi:hypothetical protein